jgi:hypothetical protein
MTQYIGCDTHLKYSVFRMMDEKGELGPSIRVEHAGGELERFPGDPVYGSSLSDGNRHQHDNLPTILAGGGNGRLRGGRHLRFPKVRR